MAAMSNYLENKLVDAIFRAQAFTFPTTVYVALYTADPTDAGGAGEVSGGGYARKDVACSLTTWKSTQNDDVASTGSTGNTKNSADIVFAAPTANWGSITHFAICDALTAGNILFHGALGTAKTVNNGDPAPKFTAASLSITLA